MTYSLFLSMFAFSLAASISPGPVNFVSLASGLRFGFNRTMRHVTGATIGFTLLLLFIGLGLHKIISHLPHITFYIQWFGVIFFVYMATQLFKDDGSLKKNTNQRAPSYSDGALMQWLNPKAWIAAVAGMGAFTTAGDTKLIIQFSIIYFVVCYISLAAWAYAGSFLRHYLDEPIKVRWFNRFMGFLLLTSAVYLSQQSN
ncbi:LysE family translocator [Hydromonas duriensis]|uniref:Threonine/homoserine/homoserine lactone efflux protein n=1 Tax=Hydromonas duriensis TaxID=1527608 RepID=A0A4R6YBP7_9BURK|nr:LysE family translocator [Hydromonas duriensis]TDR33086.1 threonine/homoserine/homoserine lactone efflux protein [Hydromonas duriensis]